MRSLANSVGSQRRRQVRLYHSFYTFTVLNNYVCANLAYENIVITTRSHPEAFPSVLRQKRKTQTKVHESGETRMIVRYFIYFARTPLTILICVQVTEQCPNCGHDEAYSEEKQVSRQTL